MLQKLRDKTTGWIATAIVGLLIIPFAFFGLEQYMVGGAGNTAAVVKAPPSWWNSAPSFWPASMLWQEDEISLDEFRERFDQVRQQRREVEGEGFDARTFEALPSRVQVLGGLVDERVQAIAARQAGLRVGDALVRDTIQGIPAFQVDGRFDPQRYRLALSSQIPPQSPRQFEQVIRQSLEQSLLAGALAGSEFVTAGELERVVQLLGERRDVSMLLVPADGESAAQPVADEALQAWYDAHPDDYRAPENVTIEYIVVDAEALPEPPPADEATLRQRFAAQAERQGEQAQRLVSHILVEVPEGAGEDAVQAARDEAAGLAAQASADGADFAALAASSSDDPGSAEQGGDLGWVTPGTFPDAIDTALAAMQPGEVSEPVRTEFGWHVLWLREVQQGESESFEQARERLAAEQAQADRDNAFDELSRQVVDAVLQSPASLQPAAEAVGVQVKVLGPFTRESTEGLAAEPAIRRAAFSEAQIEDRMISDPISLGAGRNAWLRVTGHNPEQPHPLAEVRGQVEAAVRARRLHDAASERARELESGIAAAGSLALLAEAEGLDAPQSVPQVPRGAPLVAPGVSEAIFAAPAPAEDTLSSGHQVLDDGGIVLFTVDAVTPGDAGSVPAEQAEILRSQLVQAVGIDDVQALVETLRSRFKIEVFEQNL
ncbi:SurA N-terminal domain-containing protein [Lysobacter sp. GX 14042]|uniref:SurA N-terminal domain-containing protein n=1 Tax=Lysobacter sp. GX 14042 TaxID=2907155 RepID=UPI001F2AEAA8|nr:SurA N-terminal domain-containing protein [Lysobacter sp. GX 14042]MCE7032483.1 SurA N-terminal domain-containing protein [Lysobacter sp. GX 14042]